MKYTPPKIEWCCGRLRDSYQEKTTRLCLTCIQYGGYSINYCPFCGKKVEVEDGD